MLPGPERTSFVIWVALSSVAATAEPAKNTPISNKNDMVKMIFFIGFFSFLNQGWNRFMVRCHHSEFPPSPPRMICLSRLCLFVGYDDRSWIDKAFSEVIDVPE